MSEALFSVLFILNGILWIWQIFWTNPDQEKRIIKLEQTSKHTVDGIKQIDKHIMEKEWT